MDNQILPSVSNIERTILTSGNGTGTIKRRESREGTADFGFYEFLIVINLPKWVDKYMVQLKEEFYEHFGSYYSRHSKPHITISKFPFLLKHQEAILSEIKEHLREISPIHVELNGFESYKNSNNRVISIHVEESNEIIDLKETFHRIKESLDYIDKYFFVFSNPHVTIARDLRKNIFEKAKMQYLSRVYRSSFVIDKLKVLRREIREDGTFGRYEDICDLLLSGKK